MKENLTFSNAHKRINECDAVKQMYWMYIKCYEILFSLIKSGLNCFIPLTYKGFTYVSVSSYPLAYPYRDDSFVAAATDNLDSSPLLEF